MRLSLIKQVFASSLRRSAANASSNVPVEAPGADRVLRKIDLRKEMASLPEAQQMYIKRIIAKNNERYEKEKKLKLHHRISGAILFSVVFSIYFYSMYAVKQEKFLDDFDMPEPPHQATQNSKK